MTIESTTTSRWHKRIASVPAVRALRAKTIDGTEVLEAYPPHPGRRLTLKEFLGWVHERTRAEWVEGEVIIMSPVNYVHDQLQGWCFRLIAACVEDCDAGVVCGNEFYMALSDPGARRLPDVSFISKANPGKFKNAEFAGSPDLIVEIVSPDSIKRDYEQKFSMYQSSLLKEYWIIDPLEKRLTAYELVKGKFRKIAGKKGSVHSKVLPGFFLKPAWLWQSPLPKVSVVLREMGVK